MCFTRPWALLAAIGGGLKRRLEERWQAFLEPEAHERLSYVFYYWRARFRTPLRLLLVLGVSSTWLGSGLGLGLGSCSWCCCSPDPNPNPHLNLNRNP